MPNYDYQCADCGHRFEVFQSMTEPKLESCPECGGKVARLIGPGAGMIFKGSGFYITDYRSDSYKKKEKAESGGSKAPATDTTAASKSQSGDKKTGGAQASPTPPAKTPKAKDSKPGAG